MRSAHQAISSAAFVPGASAASIVHEPFALVVGCADARAPIELIFGQGINDVFVLRVAGNVLGGEVIGSVDYALEYLPTLRSMRESCRASLTGLGLPAARDAFLEACRAGAPRAAQRWSHPAVYHAGCATGWQLLAGSPEKISWPVFREHYERCCDQVLRGETLALPAPAATTPQQVPRSTEQQLASLRKLRGDLGL